jgi:hypothetical protein
VLKLRVDDVTLVFCLHKMIMLPYDAMFLRERYECLDVYACSYPGPCRINLVIHDRARPRGRHHFPIVLPHNVCKRLYVNVCIATMQDKLGGNWPVPCFIPSVSKLLLSLSF